MGIPQKVLVRGGFVLVAVASVAVGLVMRDGGEGEIGLYLAFVVLGAGLVSGFGSTLPGAPAAVRPEGAADASVCWWP
ncbi:hypothetical protein OHA88_30305 [Streptomyces sp. NBC_00353]|uniref:hypothetical protein n=1 Tax=Streptomyces sp. NBC_00353 TaxID=2975722 RepID=UPI002E258F17